MDKGPSKLCFSFSFSIVIKGLSLSKKSLISSAVIVVFFVEYRP